MNHQSSKLNSGVALMGFAEALSSPEVAWSLADAGFRVTAFSRAGQKSALRRSRYVTVHEITAPEEDLEATLGDLKEVVQNLGQENESRPLVLFPLDDTALWLCSRLSLPKGWHLAGPQCAQAQFALDKAIQINAAKSAGLQVPETVIATTEKQVLEQKKHLPLILRPAQAVNVATQGRLRKGSNWICASEEELKVAVDEWRQEYPLLVQRFNDGTGTGVFGFAGSRGIECWSAHKRLRMMNPHGSGSSACVSQPVPEGLKDPIERIIRENHWHGLFMFEFLQEQGGQYWFIEFNGRAWGSMALARRQGLEYPAWNANLAMNPGFAVPPRNNVCNEVVCRNIGRELMHLLFVLRGRKSAAIKNWPSFWKSAMDVLRIDRRDRFYNFRRDDLRVFFTDCFCTVRNQMRKPRRRAQRA